MVTGCLLCARHCSDYFVCIQFFNSHNSGRWALLSPFFRCWGVKSQCYLEWGIGRIFLSCRESLESVNRSKEGPERRRRRGGSPMFRTLWRPQSPAWVVLSPWRHVHILIPTPVPKSTMVFLFAICIQAGPASARDRMQKKQLSSEFCFTSSKVHRVDARVLFVFC